MYPSPNQRRSAVFTQRAIACLAVAITAAAVCHADDVLWTGGNALWTAAGKWNPHLPDWNTSDHAFIESGTATIQDGIDGTSGAVVVRNAGGLTVTGGSLTMAGPDYAGVYLAIGDAGSGTGVLTMSGGLIDAGGGRISVGFDVGAQGTATVSGGTIVHSNEFWVGQGAGATGKLTVSGTAEISGTSWFAVGREGATGELIVKDTAVVRKSNGGNFKIAGDNDSHGTASIEGSGQFLCQGGVMEIGVGSNTVGELTIKDSALVETAGYWSIMGGGGNTAALNLNGGTLKTNWIGKDGGTTTINFNGGTLVAQENGTSYLAGFAESDLHVQAGGFKFDSNGWDVTIVQGLGGSGSLTKLGEGTLRLTGTSSYAGSTTVSAGTLVLSNNNVLGDTAAVNLYSMAGLVLNHTGTDIVGSLVVGGQTQPAGTYTFGTGKLQVGGGAADPFATWAASKGLDGTPGKESGPDDDPDKDGRTNLSEFAFGGNPLSGSDTGRVYVMAADSDFAGDPSTAKELILTIAVRSGAPAFAGTTSVSSLVDGVTYTVEGGVNLAAYATAVHPVSPVTTGLPAAGTGYEYRSFSLEGSDGLGGKGFLRARVVK